ncbi:hypothetical protein OJAV_G00143230 [Oryzias javanicus]|uniref:Uncharacterized protein n=1 Tax=Oryzias javanicus TaxID=123683 RepID=A0A3S2PDS1_ORYJA|nr:hypothetical protein OJAV_G00143230 [Oryzias javanicus]
MACGVFNRGEAGFTLDIRQTFAPESQPAQPADNQGSSESINKTTVAPAISQNLTTSASSASAAQNATEKPLKTDDPIQTPTEKSPDTAEEPAENSPPKTTKASPKTVKSTASVPTTTVKHVETTKPNNDAPQSDVPPKTPHASVPPSNDLTTEQNSIMTDVSDYDKGDDEKMMKRTTTTSPLRATVTAATSNRRIKT